MSTKEKYWKYSLITIILGLGIILFRQITPFLGGLLGALTIYILVRNQMFYLSVKKKMKRSLAATIITAEAILCFLVPLALVVWLAVVNLQNINLDPQAITAPFEEAAKIIKEKTGYNILGGDIISYVISILPRIGQALMGGISSFAVNMFVLVFVLYFMLIGGRKMEQYIDDILPFNAANTQNVIREINLIVRSNAIGIPLLAIIQGGVAMIGYWIFGAPNILLSGFLTSFASIIPMVGTALVWIPIAAYMALIGNWFQAAGLAIFGTVVISQLDNLIRFIIQKKMADIHPLITIFGVVIGLSLFGFMGIIFGPLLLSLFFLFVDMFKKGYLDGEGSSKFLN
nr:AI-2E family transporter [uncultured Bacteroides sp.]